MALTAAQTKQLKTFVASNYAPKLRKSALKKFTLKAQKSGMGFITAATARKAAKNAPPAPGPYDRYKALPGAVGTLETMDKQSAAHQQWAKDVQSWAGQTITPMQQAGAQASQYYAGLGAQYAGLGALPGFSPNATVGGATVTPGAANTMLDQANTVGAGTAAAGTQAASYQGFLSELSGRNLAQGIVGNLGAAAQAIPGVYNAAKVEYMQKLDENLFEMEQAQAEAQAKAKIEEAKLANQRFIAQTKLLGTMTGIQQRADASNLAAVTKVKTTNSTNATRTAIAAMDQATKREIARSKGEIDKAKLNVAKAKTAQQKKAANTQLLRKVQAAFDTLWEGKPGDAITGQKPTGWRHTARSKDKATREKASLQIYSWLAGTGLPDALVLRLMRSKGFTDAETRRAWKRVATGGGF